MKFVEKSFAAITVRRIFAPVASFCTIYYSDAGENPFEVRLAIEAGWVALLRVLHDTCGKQTATVDELYYLPEREISE